MPNNTSDPMNFWSKSVRQWNRRCAGASQRPSLCLLPLLCSSRPCCCRFKCQSLWFSFLLLHLTLVMKSGLLCFSHYLFIKDMTRKWGLPWRWLHKVSKLYAVLHCLLFCQECCVEWEARGVFFFFLLFFVFPPYLRRPPLPPLFFCGSNNDLQIGQSAAVIFFSFFVHAERFH